MTRRHRVWSCFVALALVGAACSSDGFDAGVEGEEAETVEPTVATEPEETPTPAAGRVQILSGTVSDLLDRRDLTFTVTDTGAELVRATIPDVVGLEAGDAVDGLNEAGFTTYRVETFPPSDGDEIVVDMWPSPGTDFVQGVNVFLELDGPVDAVPVEVGDQLAGIVNGQQFLAFDQFENWLIRVWLDDPIAIEVPGDPLTIGREVELAVAADEITCASGAPVPDATDFMAGAAVSFTLDEDPVDTVRFRSPERLSATDVTVDCS